MSARPTLTAAICTRDRPELLARALASLAAQAEPPEEVLVVDDAPADGRAEAVVRGAGARYVREPVAGLDFARNAALARAEGEVVAFLDDDAVADPGWCGAIRAAFARDAKVGAVTGRVEPRELATAGQRLFEANGGFARGRRPIRLPADRDAGRPLHGRAAGRRAPLIAWAVSVGSGASLAVRRDLALALGGFDEALDLGPALPGGGDHDMLWRVLHAGHDVVYEPAALARHLHRRELAAAVEQIAGHQRALVALLVKCALAARGRERLEVALFLAWRLAKPWARLARRATGRDPLPAGALLRLAWACWRGLWAYPLARRTAVRRRALALSGQAA